MATSTPQPFHPRLSSFNSSHTQYAALLPGLGDSDKLRVWDLSSSVVISEWDIPRQAQSGSAAAGKVAVSLIEWANVSQDFMSSLGQKDGERQTKKRRKSQTQDDKPTISSTEIAEVVFVVSGTTAQLFSPTSPKSISKSTLPFAPQAMVYTAGQGMILASSNQIAVYDIASEKISASSSAVGMSQPITAVSSVIKNDTVQVILASSDVLVVSFPLPLSVNTPPTISSALKIGLQPAQDLVSFSDSTNGNNRLILALAEEESRIVSLLSFVADTPRLLATLPLPTIEPVHCLSLGPDGLLFALSTSGVVYGFDMESALSPKAIQDQATGKSLKKKRAPIPTIQPISTIRASTVKSPVVGFALGKPISSSGKPSDGMDVDEDEVATELIMGLSGGVGRVMWQSVKCLGGDRKALKEVVVKGGSQKLLGTQANEGADPLQRYRETPASKTFYHADADSQLLREDNDLPVDGDLAEMTLADRLAVLNPSGAGEASSTSKQRKELDPSSNPAQQLTKQNAQSLSRMLLQALHTSDPQLLDLVLTSPANSTSAIVRNTIRKLPAAMALPLLKACVERLGQGAGSRKRGGGRGGGMNQYQGTNVVAWIRGVLVERGAVLMTIPTLPVQLAALTRLLDNRLQLHSPLLALSGRLDLAIEQIELRQSILAAKSGGEGGVYIEGESESEVEIEREEEGFVEDVRINSRRQGTTEAEEMEGEEEEDDEEPVIRLNGHARKLGKQTLVNGDLELEDDDEDEEDEDDDEDEDEDMEANGFVDDQAEEESDEDEEDEDEA